MNRRYSFRHQVHTVMRDREPAPLWRFGGKHRQKVLDHFLAHLQKCPTHNIESLQKLLQQCYIEFYDEAAGDAEGYAPMALGIWKLLKLN